MAIRVLVTGGAGFVGANLVRRVTGRCAVRVLDSGVAGSTNVLPGEFLNEGGSSAVRIVGGPVVPVSHNVQFHPGSKVMLSIRPEQLRMLLSARADKVAERLVFNAYKRAIQGFESFHTTVLMNN